MYCIEYLKSFYNEFEFRVQAYAPLLPLVVEYSTGFLRQLFSMNKQVVVNEMLELYRFIVDKYSCSTIAMPSGDVTVIVYLVRQLDFIYVCLKTWSCPNEDDRPKEEVLVVQTVLRIML